MSSDTIQFEFFSDTYEVERGAGGTWVSPHNLQQHPTIGQAVRAELSHAILASGDDPEEREETQAAIQNAIDQAWERFAGDEDEDDADEEDD